MTLIAQPHILMAVGTGVTTCNLTAEGMYTGVIKMLAVSTSVDTGNEIMNNLVSTGGMAGMLNTIWLIIAAMAFGGIMKACGMIQSFFCYLSPLMSIVLAATGWTIKREKQTKS